MNAAVINRLVRLSPVVKGSGKRQKTIREEASIFAHQYANPAFGWYIAGLFARAKSPMPVALMGADAWVHRAWMMRADRDKWYNPHIDEAHELATAPSLYMNGEKIRAYILAGSQNPKSRVGTLRTISRELNIAYKTLEAFESLFYNIFDRALDNLYLANELYPQTRSVELQDDYFKTVNPADLLKRAAYNHKDLRLTLYLSGVGGAEYLSSLAERPDREVELSKRIIGNALVLATTGLLNQRSVGMQRGQALLAAARAGGMQEESSPLESIGQMLIDHLSTISADETKLRMDLARRDAGVVVDVEQV